MKKFFAVILMIFSLTVINTSSASATEFLLGVRGGYFIWEPWIKDAADFFEEMDTGNGALYGPVASIMLTDNLTLSFSGYSAASRARVCLRTSPEKVRNIWMLNSVLRCSAWTLTGH